ncbi:hypothetical protein HQP04_21080 [Rhodococcus fascians]|nr:hypothetical protein [Rhodococcus fascians]MBY4024521.1 hypothetical protein [Rhodococcus fascians]
MTPVVMPIATDLLFFAQTVPAPTTSSGPPSTYYNVVSVAALLALGLSIWTLFYTQKRMDRRERENWQRDKIIEIVHEILRQSQKLKRRFDRADSAVELALRNEVENPRPHLRELTVQLSILSSVGASHTIREAVHDLVENHFNVEDESGIGHNPQVADSIVDKQVNLSSIVAKELKLTQ